MLEKLGRRYAALAAYRGAPVVTEELTRSDTARAVWADNLESIRSKLSRLEETEHDRGTTA